MTSRNYREVLAACRERTSWQLDQRTDAPEFAKWIRRTREALRGIYGRDSDQVHDFDKLISVVKQNALADHWRLKVVEDFLDDRLSELNTEKTVSSPSALSDRFDVVVVCALPDPELASVRKLSAFVTLLHSPDDPQTYHQSTWQTNAGLDIRLVAAAPNQFGLTATGVLAAKMVWRFRPKLIAIVGIAAGTNPKKQGFGDILAPSITYDAGSSKTTIVNGIIQTVPNANPIAIEPRLHGRLLEWAGYREKLDGISNAWPAQTPPTKLQIHTGPLFSSATVLDATAPVAAEISHWRKLVGVEMEAHAVHRASTDTAAPAPIFLCLKSICDFAEGKNDDWQRYAAFTSAQFLHRFLLEEWETLTSNSGIVTGQQNP